MKILIKFNDKEILAELNESNTANKIYNSLPLEANGNTWGEEIYFEIPVECEEENSQEEVEIGDLAYWLQGSGFCIFFGKTPASTSEKPRAASSVNVFGKVANSEVFKEFKSGSKIRIEKG